MILQIIKSIFREFRETYYLLSGKPKGVGYVMMMHHILPKKSKEYPVDDYLNITPESLEKFIIDASKYFDIIPLSDVPNRISNPHKHKFIAFTIDDGFESVYHYAYPIFKKYNIPFNSFVCTGYLGKECKTYTPVETFENGMTKEQLLELNKDPLVTIGGHTVSHKRLAHIPVNEMKREISDNIQTLKDTLGSEIKSFAYPYGDVSENIISELSSSNYNIDIAVLATGGAVTTVNINNYMIPRVNLDNTTRAKKLLHWRDTYMGL